MDVETTRGPLTSSAERSIAIAVYVFVTIVIRAGGLLSLVQRENAKRIEVTGKSSHPLRISLRLNA